jgi:hypothetical protein
VHYQDKSIVTPEGISFEILSMRINYCPNSNGKNSITINWNNQINDEGIDPDIAIEVNGTPTKKLYVFHSDEFNELSTMIRGSQIAQLIQYKDRGGYWGHYYSILILINNSDSTAFEQFLNMTYGDSTTLNTWKYNFELAVDLALGSSQNIEKLEKYDPRILCHELNYLKIYDLLLKYEEINLTPDIIIELLNPKLDADAIGLMNKLKSNNSGLIRNLIEYITDVNIIGSITGEDKDNLNKFFLNLVRLFNRYINIYDIINYEQKVKLAYESITDQVEEIRLVKLAEDGNVFIYLNPEIQKFIQVVQYDKASATSSIINDYGEIFNFQYSIRYKNVIGYSSTQINPSPFDIIKIYFPEEEEDLSKIITYDDYLKLLLTDSEKIEKQKFIYAPAILLYFLYNNYQDRLIVFSEIWASLITSTAFFIANPKSLLNILFGLTSISSVLGARFIDPYRDKLMKTSYGRAIIESWNIIQTGLIVANISFLSISFIGAFRKFILNLSTYKTAVTTFKTNSNLLASSDAKLANELRPLLTTGVSSMEKLTIQSEAFLNKVIPNLKSGKTIEEYLNYSKGFYPPPETFFIESYISAHMLEASNQELYFIISREAIEKSEFITLPVGKYAGFKEDMDIVVNNFEKSGYKIEQLIDDLQLGPNNKNYKQSSEIYYVRVDKTKYVYTFPTGNEPGTSREYWFPGGIIPKEVTNLETGNKIFVREAGFHKLDGNGNPVGVLHNNTWETFENSIGSENIIRLK